MKELTLFNEVLLNQLSPGGVSGIIKSTYRNRLENGYAGIYLSKIENYFPKYFTLYFMLESTERKASISDSQGNLTEGLNYDVIIDFDSIKKYIPKNFLKLSEDQQKATFKDMLLMADVRVHCDCAHFYWGGMWEDLDRLEASAYEFSGTHGDDIWQDRHVASGGLVNKNIRICKHLDQVINDLPEFTENILAAIRTNKRVILPAPGSLSI